ncbi:hypothetical protein [Desulforamulus aeronauticus]|uniref:Uncharacterized protein n=1 Tax=Desulforamulus aeronauticus DSM 10349 TaxID=1121421 RepID=A0A1M6SC05_9FIRM|nr:hypothetical protein [Desulforamulus aeronauticus]SHK42235.1 hypothetical protein SAMN02745123_01796 [Desulforamulus aeronauticus DSM 10349]
MFYNKSLSLLTISEGTVDDLGIYHVGIETVLKTIPCDIQPYSSELLYRDYGFREQVTKRVFCNLDSDIKNGSIVIDEAGQRYMVKKIIEWDDYMDVMLYDK